MKSGQGLRDIAVGWSAEVLLYGRLGRQGTVDGFTCDVVLDMTVRLAPRQGGAHSPPNRRGRVEGTYAWLEG